MTDAERINWVNFREKVGYKLHFFGKKLDIVRGKVRHTGGKCGIRGENAAYGGKMTEAERIKWVIEMIEIFKNTEEKKYD